MPSSHIDECYIYPISADIEWLWECQGQPKVIATPYHEGKHYATHPNQFIPIVNYLDNLHKNGYVHGDIRAYNIVLKYHDSEDNIKPEGWLIDFDFGGLVKHNYPKYPSGYEKNLTDGFRRGESGQPITYDQDWYALGQMLFRKCIY